MEINYTLIIRKKKEKVMHDQEISEILKECLGNAIHYTERAKRDMKRVHFNEDILKEIIINPTKIEDYCENNYIVHGKRTAKIRVEFTADKSLLIHWIEYNKIGMII